MYHVYIYIYIYICVCVCIYYIYICKYLFFYAFTFQYFFVFVSLYFFTELYIFVHIYIYILYIYVCVCVCVRVFYSFLYLFMNTSINNVGSKIKARQRGFPHSRWAIIMKFPLWLAGIIHDWWFTPVGNYASLSQLWRPTLLMKPHQTHLVRNKWHMTQSETSKGTDQLTLQKSVGSNWPTEGRTDRATKCQIPESPLYIDIYIYVCVCLRINIYIYIYCISL